MNYSILEIDEKWSVEYDPKNNDIPVNWLRYYEFHSTFEGSNSVVSLFYALLSQSEQ